MAILAVRACTGHGYGNSSICTVLLRVAFAARHGLMLAIKGEFSRTVIEAYLPPAILNVATFATTLINVLPDLALVRIGMASEATGRLVLENEYRIDTAGCSPDVADQARFGPVRATKRV